MRVKKLASILLPMFVFFFGVYGVHAQATVTIEVDVQDLTTNQPISGAGMLITKPKTGSAGGDTKDTWTTNGSTHSWTVTEAGTYVIRNYEPAPGYLTAPDQTVEITQDELNGQETKKHTFTFKVDYTKAEFGATDVDTGKFVAGVHFQLLTLKGEVYKDWISTDKAERIDKIPQGTYRLKVLSVPAGYKLIGETNITVDELCKNVKLFKVTLPETPKCKIQDGKYYDDKGNETTKEKYETACPSSKSCKVENNKYYDEDGKEVTKQQWEKDCGQVVKNVPDTNADGSISIIGLGLMMIICGSMVAYKHAKQQ